MALGLKICNRCVMDQSDPNIIFDEYGNCNLCNDFMENRRQVIKVSEDEKELKEIFDKIKLKSINRKYDCIIGMSGGVDSSYMAVLAKKYDLRVLAVHMDNGWNSPISVQNI